MSFPSHVYHTLEAAGLWHIVLGTILNWVVSGVILASLRKRLRALKDGWHWHLHTQRVIADRLDTSTPGGLGEVAAALAQLHAVQEDLRRLESAIVEQAQGQPHAIPDEASEGPSEPL